MDKLFLGIKGHVVCLDKNTGEKHWATKLRSTAGITNVYAEQDKVFAYAGGYLFCLQAADGSILWTNELDGFGYGACIIATENQAASVVANQLSAQQASAVASSAATTAAASTSR